MKVLLLSSCAVLIAGCTSAPHAEDTATAAIIGGTTDEGDPSVVALFALADPTTGEGSLCTASVISPTLLVTAAHCVDPDVVGTNVQFTAYLGTDFTTSQSTLAIAATAYDADFDVNALDNGHDIGVAILAQPTTLAPLAYATSDLSGLQGDVRVVGYGVSDGTAQTGAGTKRTVTTNIDGVSDLLIQIGSTTEQTCQGDSGGPALVDVGGTPTIVGLTSFGDVGCTGGGYDSRIDLYSSFLAQYLDAPTGGSDAGTNPGVEQEPNQSAAQANPIVGGAISGTLGSATDVDWFTYTVDGSLTYVVDLSAVRPSTNIRVYKQGSGDTLELVGDGKVLGDDGDRIVTDLSTGGGTYFVRVEDDGETHTDSPHYTLTVQIH